MKALLTTFCHACDFSVLMFAIIKPKEWLVNNVEPIVVINTPTEDTCGIILVFHDTDYF